MDTKSDVNEDPDNWLEERTKKIRIKNVYACGDINIIWKLFPMRAEFVYYYSIKEWILTILTKIYNDHQSKYPLKI